MNENTAAFLKILDSADSTTGGGTAAAFAGAMAAALIAMVAHLSEGKDGLKPKSFYTELAAKAEQLSTELLNGGQEDARSFVGVRRAFALPKATEEEKTARKEAIQSAWVHATKVPLENTEWCVQALKLGMQLYSQFNRNAESDLRCALYLAQAGALGCIANIEINLPSIKNPQVVANIIERTNLAREDLKTCALFVQSV